MRRYAFATAVMVLVMYPWRQAPQAQAPTYTVQALNTSASINNLVPLETGINASGQVSGTVTDASSNTRAVRYTSGVGWEFVPGLTWGSTARGINVHGDIVGDRFVGSVTHAYRYNFATGIIDDILPLTGGTTTYGYGINDNGDVVGQGDAANFATRGFVAHPGLAAVALPSLGGSQFNNDLACGINNAGQIVETSTLPDLTTQHAVRIEADGATLHDAGTVDNTTPGSSAGCAIDEIGRIGGDSSANAGTANHAFRWAPGNAVIADAGLASNDGSVVSIAGGVSVGWIHLVAGGAYHALMHSDTNGAVDLNTLLPPNSGWVLTEVTGINASGQMVGDGLLNGVQTVFLMAPAATKDTTPPVIANLTAMPSTISKVNGLLDTVAVNYQATDNSGQIPTCQLSVSGPGVSGIDYVISGPNFGGVKAVGGRTYTFTVTCTDAANNSSSAQVNVVVQTDSTAPVISSVTATPPALAAGNTPQPVTVNVSATDDSGVATCKVTGITAPGAAAGDSQITGALSGSVNPVPGRTYTFAVQCTDYSGNASASSVGVTVGPDTTAPTITMFTLSPSTISTPNNQMVNVAATIQATDNVVVAPNCKLTNVSAPGAASGDFSITGATTAQVRAVANRTYTLTATCSDASNNQGTATATVVVAADTTPPVINSVIATPSTTAASLQLVPVSITVNATDNSGVVSCKLASITGGASAGDSQITGTMTGAVMAVGGRNYGLVAQCTDPSGNSSAATANVTVVGGDTTPPVISSIYASPDAIWPPNGKMVPVSVMVTATDNVDPSPSCWLTSISGGSVGDYAVTGQFSGIVRSNAGAVYVLTVTCRDASGNAATATTNVVVSKINGNSGAPKTNKGASTHDDDRGDHDRDDRPGGNVRKNGDSRKSGDDRKGGGDRGGQL
jgi:hypothetical protein